MNISIIVFALWITFTIFLIVKIYNSVTEIYDLEQELKYDNLILDCLLKNPKVKEVLIKEKMVEIIGEGQSKRIRWRIKK